MVDKQAMKKSMVLDLRMIRSSGIGTYIREVFPGVAKALSVDRLRFLVLNRAEFEAGDAVLFRGLKYDLREIPDRIYSPGEQLGYHNAVGSEFDFFWAPHLNLPWLQSPLVVTVHDTFHLSRPDISKWYERAYMKIALNRLEKNARAIVAVSEFAKSELLRHARIQESRIHVIPHGYAPPENVDTSKDPAVDKPYALFVGNLKTHKNLSTLVSAFERLGPQFPLELWVAGASHGLRRVDDKLSDYKHRLGAKIRFLDHVDRGELLRLYRQSSLFIAPSTYEGFGLTPLEAIMSGTPRILVSDIPAHREALRSMPIDFFPPEDALALAGMIQSSLAAPKKTYPRVPPRLWQNSIDGHIRLFEQLGLA